MVVFLFCSSSSPTNPPTNPPYHRQTKAYTVQYGQAGCPRPLGLPGRGGGQGPGTSQSGWSGWVGVGLCGWDGCLTYSMGGQVRVWMCGWWVERVWVGDWMDGCSKERDDNHPPTYPPTHPPHPPTPPTHPPTHPPSQHSKQPYNSPTRPLRGAPLTPRAPAALMLCMGQRWVLMLEGTTTRVSGWVGGWVGGWVDSLVLWLLNEVLCALYGWVGGWVGGLSREPRAPVALMLCMGQRLELMWEGKQEEEEEEEEEKEEEKEKEPPPTHPPTLPLQIPMD